MSSSTPQNATNDGQLRAAVFDLGGVVIDVCMESTWRALAEAAGQPEEVLAKMRVDAGYQPLERGDITIDEYYEHVMGLLGCPGAVCADGAYRDPGQATGQGRKERGDADWTTELGVAPFFREHWVEGCGDESTSGTIRLVSVSHLTNTSDFLCIFIFFISYQPPSCG